MLISITEAARRLNLSDTSINRRIERLGISKVKQGKYACITEEDLLRVSELNFDVNYSNSTDSNSSQPTSTDSNSNQSIDEYLKQRIECLEKELNTKNQHIEKLQMLVDQEQQLGAMRERRMDEMQQKMKLLEAPKENIYIAPETLTQWERTRDVLMGLQTTLQQRYNARHTL